MLKPGEERSFEFVINGYYTTVVCLFILFVLTVASAIN